MASIKRYQRTSDAFTTHRLHEPYGPQGEPLVTELCTLNGYVYVSIPDGVTLPAQPPEVVVEDVTLTDTLLNQINAASPHVQLINQRVVERIRGKYSDNDEFKMARMSVGALLGKYTPTAKDQALMDDYEATSKAARTWGDEQKALLGLVVNV